MDRSELRWVVQREGVFTEWDADYEALMEADEIERWIADGAPPLAPEPPRPDPASPEPDGVPVDRQIAVTKRGAGQLLGGKSEDWVEKYVLPHVPTIKPSRSVLILREDVEHWGRENKGRALT